MYGLVTEPDFLRICVQDGTQDVNGPMKPGIAYVKNGTIRFLNGNYIYTTRANEFTERALQGMGYTIDINPQIAVRNFASGHATTRVHNLVKNEVLRGNTDRESIWNIVVSDREIQLSLAFECDPMFMNPDKVKDLLRNIHGPIGYGAVSSVVNRIFSESQFANNNRYYNTTFNEYLGPIVDNVIAYYSQNTSDNDGPKLR